MKRTSADDTTAIIAVIIVIAFSLKESFSEFSMLEFSV